MGYKQAVVGAGQGGDAQRFGNASAFDDIRLDDSDISLGDEITKLPARVFLLARGDRYIQGVDHLRDTRIVVLGYRFFKVHDAELILKAPPQTDRGRHRKAVVGVE